MFSDKSKQHLVSAITNRELADDLELRLSLETPADAAEAQAALDSYSQSIEKHREYLTVALCLKEVGDEIADRLQKAENVLVAQANGDEVAGSPAVAASFEGQVAGMTTDITIEADTADADGNNIVLTFDGLDDIDAAIAAWNLANPANTATLTAGDGSQIPDNLEEIQLAGGADAVADSDADLAPALAAFGTQSLTASAQERLKSALCDETAANEFKSKYDAFVSAINDIV